MVPRQKSSGPQWPLSQHGATAHLCSYEHFFFRRNYSADLIRFMEQR